MNTEPLTVQGVLSEQHIESLPVNGRNFLELAQLDSGGQIQDAEFGFGFKDGFSSISFGGRCGRTARIEVDGIHISDEKFGSSTSNIREGNPPAVEQWHLRLRAAMRSSRCRDSAACYPLAA